MNFGHKIGNFGLKIGKNRGVLQLGKGPNFGPKIGVGKSLHVDSFVIFWLLVNLILISSSDKSFQAVSINFQMYPIVKEKKDKG